MASTPRFKEDDHALRAADATSLPSNCRSPRKRADEFGALWRHQLRPDELYGEGELSTSSRSFLGVVAESSCRSAPDQRSICLGRHVRLPGAPDHAFGRAVTLVKGDRRQVAELLNAVLVGRSPRRDPAQSDHERSRQTRGDLLRREDASSVWRLRLADGQAHQSVSVVELPWRRMTSP